MIVRIMPLLYGAVLLMEAAVLAVVYALDAPAPADPLSVWLGWAGLLSMIAMLVYSVARRSRTLRSWMRLSGWLNLHIFLGVQGVLFVAFHCSHLLTRTTVYLLNPGVLNLMAVGVVFGSGIFGRFLYARLPRGSSGEHLVGVLDRNVVQRVFHGWIILHRPIAALMFVLSFVHVALAYMFSPSLGF